jgi:ATP-dependent protease ClpP protease subunit
MTVMLQEAFKLNAAEPGKTWFDSVMLEQGDHVVEIRGIIGDWDVDPSVLIARLQSADLDVTVQRHVLRIDSQGGLVSAGVSLMTAISQLEKPVVAEIWGYCYSMATLVAMAADQVGIAKDGSFMIHNPRSCVCGTAADFAAALQYLDGVRAQAVDRYTAKVEPKGHTREEVEAAMTDAGSYYTALQAIEFGFADYMIEDKRETPRMQLDREFVAVMLGEIPEDIAVEIAQDATDAPVEDAAPALDATLEQAPADVQEDAAPDASANAEMAADPAAEAKMQALADPVVAALQSAGLAPVVQTARPAEGAQQSQPEMRLSAGTQRIAEMNRNFGKF